MSRLRRVVAHVVWIIKALLVIFVLCGAGWFFYEFFVVGHGLTRSEIGGTR